MSMISRLVKSLTTRVPDMKQRLISEVEEAEKAYVNRVHNGDWDKFHRESELMEKAYMSAPTSHVEKESPDMKQKPVDEVEEHTKYRIDFLANEYINKKRAGTLGEKPEEAGFRDVADAEKFRKRVDIVWGRGTFDRLLEGDTAALIKDFPDERERKAAAAAVQKNWDDVQQIKIEHDSLDM